MSTDNSPIKIGRSIFESPIMNAAGECKNWAHVKDVVHSSTAAVVLGSITVDPRDGNAEPTYQSFPHFSINSRGLPNLGLEYYAKHLNDMTDHCHLYDKPFIVSIAPTNPNEFDPLMDTVYASDVDFVEINLGCPNVLIEGKHKPIFAYDPEVINNVLEKILLFDLKRTFLKISPYLTFTMMESVAEVISRFPCLAAVTSCNTLPNGAYIMPDGKQSISPTYGGIAGPAILGTSLGQVQKMRELLHPNIAIIGVGGISTGEHVLAYLRAGATAVQVGTAFFDEGKEIFLRLLTEYTDLLEPQEHEV